MIEILTFDQAFEFTNGVSSTAAYEQDELRLLFECAMQTPKNGNLVEIGCEFGRSTSLLMQIARHVNCDVWLIDLYPRVELIQMLERIPYPYVLFRTSSAHAWVVKPWRIDFLHIDGSHDYLDVKRDLEKFADICSGWVCCHDYGRESLPDVKKAVDEFLAGKRVVTKQEGTCFAFKYL